MGALSSKNEVCNLAMGILGQRAAVNDIDSGSPSQQEAVFALWYDIVRQLALKEQKPNFALERRIVAAKPAAIKAFGYPYAFEYPQDCLSLLGVGEVKEKFNNYAVEGDNGSPTIYHTDEYPEGLPIRFLLDISDVSKFTPEFTLVLASMLADKVCYQITDDDAKKQVTAVETKINKATASALSGQENRPIRMNNSKFDASRQGITPAGNDKR